MHTANFLWSQKGWSGPRGGPDWGGTSPGGGAGPEVKSTDREQIDRQV